VGFRQKRDGRLAKGKKGRETRRVSNGVRKNGEWTLGGVNYCDYTQGKLYPPFSCKRKEKRRGLITQILQRRDNSSGGRGDMPWSKKGGGGG